MFLTVPFCSSWTPADIEPPEGVCALVKRDARIRKKLSRYIDAIFTQMFQRFRVGQMTQSQIHRLQIF